MDASQPRALLARSARPTAVVAGLLSAVGGILRGFDGAMMADMGMEMGALDAYFGVALVGSGAVAIWSVAMRPPGARSTTLLLAAAGVVSLVAAAGIAHQNPGTGAGILLVAPALMLGAAAASAAPVPGARPDA